MKIHLYLFKKYFIYVYMAANNIINGHQFTPGANLQNIVLP